MIGGTVGMTNPWAGGGAQNYARSLGSIGVALQNLGSQGMQIAADMQKAKNSMQENEVLNQWDSAFARHEVSMMREKNPETRIEKTEAMLSDLEGASFAQDLPPVVRDRLKAKWQAASSRMMNKSLGQASQLMIEKAMAQAGLRLDRAIKNMDPAQYQEATQDMVDNGLLTPEQKAAKDFEGVNIIEFEQDKTLAVDNPRAWLADNPKPKGLNKKKVERIARYELSRLKSEEFDIVLDSIFAGEAKNEKDIVALAPNLGPKDIARLVDAADKLSDKNLADRIKSPEYQDKLAGQLGPLIKGYNPSGNNDDEDLLKIRHGLKSLEDGLVKDRLEAQLKDRLEKYKTAQQAIGANIKSIPDWAFTQIEEYAEEGGFSPFKKGKELKEPAGKTIDAYIKGGELGNIDLLKKFGFTEEQAEQIKDSSDKWLAYYSGETTERPKVQTPDKVLQGLWANSNPRSKNFNEEHPVASTLFDAIYEGKTGTTLIQNPSDVAAYEEQKRRDKQKVEQLKGQSMRRLAEYFTTNPDAKRDDVVKFLKQMEVDISAGATDERMFPEEPELPGDLRDLDNVGASLKGKSNGIKVFHGSRDQIPNFKSTPGARKISLDFNDASNKAARGIEFVLPSDATAQEVSSLKDWAKKTQAFFLKYGIEVPIRGDEGIALKSDGSRRTGKSGVIHLEPFFASNLDARNTIIAHPTEFAYILSTSLEGIDGATIMAPHTLPGADDTNPGEGATSGGISERNFAMNYVLPTLLNKQ